MTGLETDSRNCWAILGIAPTDDEKAVRRAYASAIKSHRPDQDPEGFKRVRAAYEEALEDAAWDNWGNDELENDESEDGESEDGVADLKFIVDGAGTLIPVDVDGRETGEDVAPEILEAFERSELPDEIQVRMLVDRMEIAFEIENRAKRGRAVEDILDDPALMSLTLRPFFGALLLNYLISEADLSTTPEAYWSEFPLPVWRKMDKLFGWSEDELSIANEYDDDLTEPFFARLDALRRPETFGSPPAAASGMPHRRRLARSDDELPPVEPKKSWLVRWLPYLIVFSLIRLLIELAE